ncbi:MAG: DUF1566 domain-containing protein [Candidatus Gastranaerophilales bacterium]|nr:DUF1566 domain-containing protein [Candidatus Gastranaerophilales bacterium]
MLTIEHPLTGEKLQVANKDFVYGMPWLEAIRACQSIGSGWRLPTIEELEEINNQLFLKGEGNFIDDDPYWSSSETAEYDNAWGWFFGGGACIDSIRGKNSHSRVRAVRDL